MPKCTINGQHVEVKEGATIIEAFKTSGQDIAHYCWHPGLTVAGVCRLCMVEIQGNPRVQIACNTKVTEGMVISNQSPLVTEAVKWGLDFHLINHPLDCPICDQAGECGLQEQYMKFGQYDSEMSESKVKKSKVVDLGPKIVLDSERCILCSRCVRFTSEITKTHELGIFNRGDHSEIGTCEGKQLDNNYAYNTVDICPVGALTSKDFRFKQRVWYLKNSDTICQGCSTGCNVKVFYNEEGYYRVKPNENHQVNGYWMCDKGRELYQNSNLSMRFLLPQQKVGGLTTQYLDSTAVLGDAIKRIKSRETAFVFVGHETNEEVSRLIEAVQIKLPGALFFHWELYHNQAQEFDGLLFRGDEVPNTFGVKEIFNSKGLSNSWDKLESLVTDGKIKNLVFSAPEKKLESYQIEKLRSLLSLITDEIIWIGSQKESFLESLKGRLTLIPARTSYEKNGSFTNFSGLKQFFKQMMTLVPQALDLEQVAQVILGEQVHSKVKTLPNKLKSNFFLSNQKGMETAHE